MSQSLQGYLDVLFDSDEFVVHGNRYATKATKVNTLTKSASELICINPLLPNTTRADSSIATYRNFLFEMDTLELPDQLKLINNIGIPFSAVTYSGGKSYHAILSLAVPLDEFLKLEMGTMEADQAYKNMWQRLNAYIVKNVNERCNLPTASYCDKACRNPSRLSRLPGFKRDTGKVQELVSVGERMSLKAWEHLYEVLPDINKPRFVSTSAPLIYTAKTSKQFFALCPEALRLRIQYPQAWSASAGLYPEIFKLALWAIDCTGVPLDVFEGIMEEHVEPVLLSTGYEEGKMQDAIQKAYAYKGVDEEIEYIKNQIDKK